MEDGRRQTEEKLDEAKIKRARLDADVDQKQYEVEEILYREHGGVLLMFAEVHEGIRYSFDQMMLTRGLDVTKSKLQTLESLFSDAIKAFCSKATEVSGTFLQEARTPEDHVVRTKVV